MRIIDIRVATTGDCCELRGRVVSDFPPDEARWFAPFDLWYRFPSSRQPWLRADNGDPWLAALLLAAMRNEPRLAIAAPISPRLQEALPNLQALYAAFDPRATPIVVEADVREPAPATASGVALFFSLGVDSTYSLLKNRQAHPADDRTIAQLLYVHGVDAPTAPWDAALPPPIAANLARVADVTGATVVPIVTNVRRATAALAPWTLSHGGGLLAAALALGAGLRQVHLAASTTYDRLYPWGSHPLLDPQWSTETLTIVHDGCELHTIDKTCWIVAADPDLVLSTLRPCAGAGPDYNCGACLKCLRTMLDLLAIGALGQCTTLPHRIDSAQLHAMLHPGGPAHVAEFTRRLAALEAQGLAPDAQQVLRAHLAGGMAPKWRGAASSAAGRDGWLRLGRLARRVVERP
jgi:hypothetical protein